MKKLEEICKIALACNHDNKIFAIQINSDSGGVGMPIELCEICINKIQNLSEVEND